MPTPIEPVRSSAFFDARVDAAVRTHTRPAAMPEFMTLAPSPRIESRWGPALRSLPFMPSPSAGAEAGVLSGAPPVTSLVLREDTLRTVLRDLAQDALAAAAGARDLAPARFAEAAGIIARDHWPSRNDAGSRSTLRDSVLAKDGIGGVLTLDLHLARTGESGWQAVAFDAAGRARTGAFPYAEGTLGLTALQFDPRTGQFRLCDRGRMLQVVPVPVAQRRHEGLGRSFAPVMILAALGAAAVLLGRALA